MNITRLDDGFAVSGQIAAQDIPDIAAAGFRSIICNRPDGEGADQPAFDEIARAARAAGLEAAYLPIVPGQMSEADMRGFADLVRTMPGPVFGYCRSGARASGLWQAARTAQLLD